jgi:hypothetical protein
MTPIADQLAALVEEACARYTDPVSEETFTRCLICGEWEGHTDHCPIPVIERWAASEPAVPDDLHCVECGAAYGDVHQPTCPWTPTVPDVRRGVRTWHRGFANAEGA